MKDSGKDALKELQMIEHKTKIMENLSKRLETLEHQMTTLSQSDIHPQSLIDKNDLQKIITKITTLRDLIDKIEIEVDQLDARITDIEALRFKHRTED
ncbi:hypothetical protein EU527_05780 [Candidatus Thorarchaeota archaeon]|nr:MAG: hypothetical protein EU527_05780 [Candidatus Thorarchaeota archaeon]